MEKNARHTCEELQYLLTEARNPRSLHIDEMSALEIVTLMNEEDKTVAGVVEKTLPHIAQAVDIIHAALEKGGRLIYVGAGTSGRLGVLDAAECVPTFGIEPDQVVALIAGGERAMTEAIEGAEDDEAAGEAGLKSIGTGASDVVVGISASGRTPYVQGALRYARKVGTKTVVVVNNSGSILGKLADVAIELPTGPEVLLGSTRLKAGTAQKMVLNMLSTASFVRLGKTYQNLMIDLLPLNDKLVERSCRMLMMLTGASRDQACEALHAAGREVKVALVMLLTGAEASIARLHLQEAKGRVHEAVKSMDG